MTLFNGIRPFYPHDRTAFIFAITLLVVILVFLVFTLTLLIILPGIRGKGRVYSFCRIIVSLFVGAVIVVVNFTGDWAAGFARVSTIYKAFSNEAITAEVGLNIGLAGINVTLRGIPENQLNETIDYNESFLWRFTMNYDEQYNNGLNRGLPHPILYIAEKFQSKSPCLIHDQYRFSGHYATAMMWVAFCAWIITNILFSMPTIVYGGYMALVTSAFMIFGVISFATIQNVSPCIIQFGPTTLKTNFSVSFWLTLATALLCFILGVIVIIMDHCIPEKLKTFFMLSGEEDDDDQMSIGLISNNFTDDRGDAVYLKKIKNGFKNKDIVVYT
ncbi:dual oxidase maturation factor 1-like isoform X1 [Chiloscyllium plagiosum]|uniref:dual oxidase maturation factor 1-like isoform X1 n=1 Tax=Chiloscyllium plagiosum TaxID=36176 RepID=UPI001CB86125|nr:dual oxidase maturation factor 1-like isoform X1 [Chiloscyllium plagiosum]XP_043536215.1 dual oxidase maturation factor 1-like isoform X1 [Chiloscyllium plagiosum]XP_043536217.1 dual oxidase maturation factor 1-like isoform X1 [Chiloscyllium plagiosum]